MMKKYILLLVISTIILAGCTKDDTENNDQKIALKGFAASLGSVFENIQTKATSEFSVNNTTYDPTSAMTNRNDWNFDVQIYKGNSPYQYGKARLKWDDVDQIWIPQTNDSLYFPNYSQQGVAAQLSAPAWNGTVQKIQNTASLLLAQDVLKQNGTTTTIVNPAHIPTISMRHGNSMLDFILSDVDTLQISSVYVFVGNDMYTPYKIPGLNKAEYLVILPVGVKNPEVRITTTGGAKYIQQLSINSTQVNVCYCAKFVGLELVLASITVTDWVYGTALSGEYSTTTSYPTFLGPIDGTTVILVYDNGQQQPLSFGSIGQTTVKPLGRTIVKIIPSDDTEFDVNPPIVLRSMFINLIPHLQNRT